MTFDITERDRSILRRLAARKAEAAFTDENIERREAWYRHDEGSGGRPMVLAEISGIRDPLRPVAEDDLTCESEWARAVQRRLMSELYEFEILKDDHVLEPWMNVNWRVSIGGYGVEAVEHSADHDGKMGAKRWDPPIIDIDRDFTKLRFREKHVDREATFDEVERYESVFGGILPTRIRGSFYWTTGLTIVAIRLIGLEELMLWMYDEPEGLHRLMAFLRDDHLALADWLEAEGLYTLNNENDYIGSGSMGYTRRLPASSTTGTRNLWVLSESQETVGVGPELFEEFVFPYQRDIVGRYGMCYYGCCEPVHSRWHILERLPGLERVSVSPWADEEFMAEKLSTRYVYSRKPAPSMISTDVFDEAAIRADLRHTLTVAKDCRIELIMKDVHTLNNDPQRLPRWVEIAREEVSRAWG